MHACDLHQYCVHGSITISCQFLKLLLLKKEHARHQLPFLLALCMEDILSTFTKDGSFQHLSLKRCKKLMHQFRIVMNTTTGFFLDQELEWIHSYITFKERKQEFGSGLISISITTFFLSSYLIYILFPHSLLTLYSVYIIVQKNYVFK